MSVKKTVEPSSVCDLKSIIKLSKATKSLDLCYMGHYVDSFTGMRPYKYFVFFNLAKGRKIEIRECKVTEVAWTFKKGYNYKAGFNKNNELVYLLNKGLFIAYLVAPNKIYTIDIRHRMRVWHNKPIFRGVGVRKSKFVAAFNEVVNEIGEGLC